jgi:hypothetical protein
MNRRDFLIHAGALSAAAATAAEANAGTSARGGAGIRTDAHHEPSAGDAPAADGQKPTPGGAASNATADGAADRAYWVTVATRLADPVLVNLAERRLHERMPVEAAPGPGVREGRAKVSHLEAFGRLLCGIAPWLELAPDDSSEGRLRAKYRGLAQKALMAAVDPASPDRLNFTDGAQALVDAAFLSQAILRAPKALWESVDAATRGHVVKALESTRAHTPGFNNWLLFAATVEAALKHAGAWWDRMRVDYAIRQHQQWYKGDGTYGDGPDFHWDYYNSFVIHPMLLDVLDACASSNQAWARLQPAMLKRAQRYAAIQERLVSPEGTFPPIGRSLAYRCGAFQVLAHMSMRHALPDGVTPPQSRNALTKVIKRTIEAPKTFDAQGWLTIGFSGHQPAVGETYISTGSLYLASFALLPLGLPPTDTFWTAPSEPTTSERAWSGQPFPIDKAYSEQ